VNKELQVPAHEGINSFSCNKNKVLHRRSSRSCTRQLRQVSRARAATGQSVRSRKLFRVRNPATTISSHNAGNFLSLTGHPIHRAHRRLDPGGSETLWPLLSMLTGCGPVHQRQPARPIERIRLSNSSRSINNTLLAIYSDSEAA